MTCKVLLFDVMDTLVVDPFYTVFPAFFGAPLREVLRQKNPNAWPAFERGELTEAQYRARAFVDGRAYDYDGMTAQIFAAYRFVDGMEALLGALAEAGAKMHILSNYPVWYRQIEARLSLSRFLPWTFVSCETGVRKPDAEAYLGPARRLGVSVDQLVLIDDRAQNCDAARALGLDAILFEGAVPLRAALFARGFLPEP